MTDAKKHHFVPQFLLREFAGTDQKLHVHGIDNEREFDAKPRGLAQTNNGHALISLDGSTDRSTLERRMSSLEGEAATAIRDLQASTERTLTEEQIDALSWLAGLQYYRSRFVLGYLDRASPASGMTNLEVQTAMLHVGVGQLLDAWSASKDPSARPKDGWNGMVSTYRSFHWSVVRFTKATLLVSDSFAAQSGVRADVRGKYDRVDLNWSKHGIQVPLLEAGRITIPLTPGLGLFLSPEPGVRAPDARQFNRCTVYNARSFVAYPTEWLGAMPRSVEKLDEWLVTQRWCRQLLAANF